MFDVDLGAVHQHPSIERAFWLLGGRVASETTYAQPAARVRTFDRGGFFVFHDEEHRARLIFQTGPALGEPLFAGHMHADLMGVYVSIDDKALIVDAGTYTYRTSHSRTDVETRWRQYFRGPAAHNGLCIGGADPLGSPAGDFRGSRIDCHAATTRTSTDLPVMWIDAVVRDGAYDGYRRGVVHLPGEYWIVYDVLPAFSGDQERHFGFQLAPSCAVAIRDERSAAVSMDVSKLDMSASAGLVRPDCLEGSLSPVGGWVSRRYGEIDAAPQLRFGVQPGVCESAFLLQTHAIDESRTIEATRAGNNSLVIDVASTNCRDRLLVHWGDANEPTRIDDVSFHGQILWFREREDRVEVISWINGRSAEIAAHGICVDAPDVVPKLKLTSKNGQLYPTHFDPSTLRLGWPGTRLSAAKRD